MHNKVVKVFILLVNSQHIQEDMHALTTRKWFGRFCFCIPSMSVHNLGLSQNRRKQAYRLVNGIRKFYGSAHLWQQRPVYTCTPGTSDACTRFELWGEHRSAWSPWSISESSSGTPPNPCSRSPTICLPSAACWAESWGEFLRHSTFDSQIPGLKTDYRGLSSQMHRQLPRRWSQAPPATKQKGLISSRDWRIEHTRNGWRFFLSYLGRAFGEGLYFFWR